MKYANKIWKGFHMRFSSHEDVPALKWVIEDALVPMGVNILILEVNTNFMFESHPEVAGGTLTAEDAHELTTLCKKNDIRLIPLFECLGHQGWGGTPNTLLEKYPEFDETPYILRDAKWPDFYCRSWCPLHPDINKIIFDLMDELIDAFEADAFHVGMDEVFAIGDDKCPRCKGKDKAWLYAKAVNDYYKHLVNEKGVEMFMWGDRLIDAKTLGYTQWEADIYGISSAIDMIPKDIIICDWHYEMGEHYRSVEYFMDKGFRVFPSCWKDTDAALAFFNHSFDVYKKHEHPERMLGMLVTGWNAWGGGMAAALLGDGDLGDDQGDIKGIARTLRVIMDEMKDY